MKIGVISDTHGYLDLMRQAAGKMVGDHYVSTIIHLGDDSTDAEELASPSLDIIWVPGIYESRYIDPSIPNRIIREFENVTFLISHTPHADNHDLPGDIDPVEAIEDGDVQVFLHGHSHLWRISEERGVIIINPGHMLPRGHKAGKGYSPTYAVLDLTVRRLGVKIISADDNELLAEKTFFFNL